MHMYESRANAASIVGEEAFSVKITFFDHCDLNVTLTFDPPLSVRE